MKHCFKRWLKIQNVNVSKETTIEKCRLHLFILDKYNETFLGIKRMVQVPEKQ